MNFDRYKENHCDPSDIWEGNQRANHLIHVMCAINTSTKNEKDWFPTMLK